MEALPLAELQRLLYRLISAPEAVDAAARSAGAALPEILEGDGETPAAARLAVYAEAYFLRIHDALQEDFAALARVIGAEAFHDLVLAYLCAHPSTSPSLRDAGDHLAEFIARSEALGRMRAHWPFLADLARFELAYRDVFDAADAPVARAEDFASIAPERFAEQELRLVPAFRRLSLAYPVHELYEAWERDQPIPERLDAVPTELAVARHHERTGHRTISAAEAAALARVAEGALFGDVCGVAESFDSRSAAEQAAAWLRGWLEAGWLLALSPRR